MKFKFYPIGKVPQEHIVIHDITFALKKKEVTDMLDEQMKTLEVASNNAELL